jgi:spermidine synthase
VIFVSGFAASALEIVLLLGLQVLVGSVYRQVGVVVTVFMTGLALGSALAARWLAISRPPAPARVGFEARGLHCSRQSLELPLGLLAVALALLALALPLLLQALSRAAAPGEGVAQCLIALVAFVIACLVGAQFPLANRVEAASSDPAARLYVADFIGASLGALLTSTVLVPVIGIAGVCGVVGALNLAAAAMILWRTTNG